jgi:hypothetical protein
MFSHVMKNKHHLTQAICYHTFVKERSCFPKVNMQFKETFHFQCSHKNDKLLIHKKSSNSFLNIIGSLTIATPNYVRLHHICYVDDFIIVWTSIFGETYSKNVTSFLKEDLLGFNIRFNRKKTNLMYIISNRIDFFS